LPVSDVERALRLYVDKVGFTLDVDYSPNDAFRVVQLTRTAAAGMRWRCRAECPQE
jgi:catechol 2,3-dioxygenase-like lactoylglutathione lyase family enzyme